MTQLHFLSSAEKRKFDLPPVFTHDQRPAYFVVTDDIRRSLSALRTPINKVGFMLQLGYFKHSGKFFEKHMFRQRDIKFVKQLFNIIDDIDFVQYSSSSMAQHQARIRKLLGWSAFCGDSVAQIASHVQIQTEQQIRPDKIFKAAVDCCWQQRIEIPTHHQLASVITDSFNIVESAWLCQLEKSLQPNACDALDTLLESSDGLPVLLSEIRAISASLQPKAIRKNVDTCLVFAEHLVQFGSAFSALNLPEKATEHYATWVKKATITQLNTFPNRWKRYLHLLAFIQHQYSLRQDLLMDIFLKSTQAGLNAATKEEDRRDLGLRAEQAEAIRVVSRAHKSAQRLLSEIAHIARCEDLPANERLAKIEQLLSDHEALQNDQAQDILQRSEQLLVRQVDPTKTYDALEKQSVKLQFRVSLVMKTLVFDTATSDADLLAAVNHFQVTDGQVGKTAPLDFLADKEQALFADTEPFRTSLYKILLFRDVATAVRSGKLNLEHSYRYRAIQDYLIPVEQWSRERDHLLAMAGLDEFRDCSAVLDHLKIKLDASYQHVNKRIQSGENAYLAFDKKGVAKVRTPETNFSEDGYVGQMLVNNGIVPVLQILREISQSCNFLSCFKHLSPKHHKLKPSVETVLAGILGKGCNIGIHKLSQISQGINQSTLKNTVNWCFTLKNIQAANTQLLQAMDKLSLPNAFQHIPSEAKPQTDKRVTAR